MSGEPGLGKSVTLRLLVDRLQGERDLTARVLTRPQSNTADFYRELGELFEVPLSLHNRWAGAKVLRERWQAHIDAALTRARRETLVQTARRALGAARELDRTSSHAELVELLSSARDALVEAEHLAVEIHREGLSARH